MTVDRKALSREYRESPRVMGVGMVRNSVNGRTLVFASRDLPSLLNRQRAELRLGTHKNLMLMADWRNDGADAFEFAVLDTLEPADEPDYDPGNDLQVLEDMWMEKLKPFEPDGYHTPPK